MPLPVDHRPVTIHRLPCPRPEIDALLSYVPGIRASTDSTAALASNESHFAPLPSVLKSIGDTAASVNRYPDTAALELRERLAEHLGVSVDEVSVGPGSLGVLSQIITAFCGPGDEVIYPWRSFEAYPLVVQISGAASVAIPLRADEGHDLEAMLGAITPRTRVIVVCTPNNPTGLTVSHSELAAFLARVPSEILVVIDEAYIEFATSADTSDILTLYRQHQNICILRTFSKAYGLAGLRIGYSVAQPAISESLRKTGLPFSVSSFAQQAAIASIKAADELRERVAHVVSERTRLLTELRAIGRKIPDSEANFLWLRCSDDERAQLINEFLAENVLVRGYPQDGVRITLADREANNRVLTVLKNHEYKNVQTS